MRGRYALVLLSLVMGIALASQATSIEQILKYRTLGDVEVSPDGTRAVFVATVADPEENVMNSDLWLVELASGRYFQLTRGPKRDSTPRWAPDNSGRIAFLSDRSGRAKAKQKEGEKDKMNLWMIGGAGGEAEQVTDGKSDIASFAWLPDASGFIFAMTDPPSAEEERRKKDKEDPILVDRQFKYARLYRFKLGEKEPTLLTKEDYHVSGFDLSPEGRWVAFAAQPTPKVPDFRHSDLRMLDLESVTVRALVTRPGMDAAPRFSPDGRWIAFVSTAGHDDWHGNSYLHIVRPDGSGLKNISESFDEEIGAFGGGDHRWSADGQSIYYLGGQGVAERLFRIHVATSKFEAVGRENEQGVCHGYGVSGDGRTAALVISDPHIPAEVYRLDLARGGQEKLTRINADFVGTAPSTVLLRYRSPDGLELEGLVMKPKSYDPGKRYPLLVIIHGGPAGVFQYNFAPRRGAYPLHAFTDQGYVLFLPNPRGSGGYGERFRQANVRDWGYGDYRDIMQGVDLLIERGLADPERMGVMGWSYGGYMTSWIVSQTTRFKAASMGAGLSNLISMYGTTDIPEFNEAYFGGSKPWEDPQGWLKHSAINFVGQAKTPTLIQHGQEDRRVPLSQGEEFYLALKKVGVPVEMVVYPRQPHGIQEPRLIKDALERNLHWFNKWLLGIEPPKEGKTETKKTDD